MEISFANFCQKKTKSNNLCTGLAGRPIMRDGAADAAASRPGFVAWGVSFFWKKKRFLEHIFCTWKREINSRNHGPEPPKISFSCMGISPIHSHMRCRAENGFFCVQNKQGLHQKQAKRHRELHSPRYLFQEGRCYRGACRELRRRQEGERPSSEPRQKQEEERSDSPGRSRKNNQKTKRREKQKSILFHSTGSRSSASRRYPQLPYLPPPPPPPPTGFEPATAGMGAKKAEPELGSFDCVHAEHGKAPSVGKVTIFKTSLVFKAEMFGLDNTTLSIKRRDLDAVDATSMLTLPMTYKETRQMAGSWRAFLAVLRSRQKHVRWTLFAKWRQVRPVQPTFDTRECADHITAFA